MSILDTHNNSNIHQAVPDSSEDKSESEMYSFNPYKKCIQRLTERTTDMHTDAE